MLLKCAVFFLVILCVQSATLWLDHDITSNLAEKVQLSADDSKDNQLRLKKLDVVEENLLVPETDQPNLINILDQKVQLSPEELLHYSKQNTIHHSIKKAPGQGDLDLDILGERPQASNKNSLVQQAQDIIEKGLKHLKNNFSTEGDEIAPSTELWEKLEKDVEEYFLQQKNKLGARQGTNQQNSLNNFTNGFQQLTNNFIQQFQGQKQSNQPAASEDERTAIAGAGTARSMSPTEIVNHLTDRVQYIVNSLQKLGQNIFQRPQQGTGQIVSDNQTQGSSSGPVAKASAGEQSTAVAVAKESPETKPEEVEKKEVMTATE